MSARIIEIVTSLGLQDHGIVVSSGVLEALGIRTARDIDISVNDNMLQQLKRQGNWEVATFPDGKQSLSRGNIEIFPGWSILSYEDLAKNANTINGVKFASLSQVYAWKKQANRPKDPADLDAIRQRLHSGPLHKDFLRAELALIRSLLPKHLHHHHTTFKLANELCAARTLLDQTASAAFQEQLVNLLQEYATSRIKDIALLSRLHMPSLELQPSQF